MRQLGFGIIEVGQEILIFVHGLVALARCVIDLAKIEVRKRGN